MRYEGSLAQRKATSTAVTSKLGLPSSPSVVEKQLTTKFCFDVSLKIETRPERGERFTISVERSPDHGRSTMLGSDKMSGFIEIR